MIDHNLISKTTLRTFRANRAKRMWHRVLASGFLLTFASIAWMQSVTSSYHEQTKQELDSATEPKLVAEKNRVLRSKLTNVKKQFNEQVKLRSEFNPLAVLQLLATMKSELNGNLTLEQLDFSLSARDVNSKPASPRTGRVTLQIVTTGTAESSRILQMLRQSSYFSDVKLSTALSKLDTESDNIRFSVLCEF